MVIPLMKQAEDEHGTDEHAPLRFGAAWAAVAARAGDARQALHTFLTHAPHAGRTAVPASLAMDAGLVISELVTNAIVHAPGPCGMALQLSGEELAITVWDTSTEKPVVRKRDRHRVGGHGLRLVHAVSDRVAVAHRARGKQITAYLRLTPSSDASAGPFGRDTAGAVSRPAASPA
ncbi:ATP-binding protein [Streptomyces sp. NPDC048751]|uniref:ATP-binding protein n=1 Tax=Streptomyces sp. NPDC048751 TaxID=3365591 RepID=UPI00371903AC